MDPDRSLFTLKCSGAPNQSRLVVITAEQETALRQKSLRCPMCKLFCAPTLEQIATRDVHEHRAWWAQWGEVTWQEKIPAPTTHQLVLDRDVKPDPKPE